MPSSSSLCARDLLSIAAVVFVWGANFVVIKYALHGVSPMTLCALRFLFASLPFMALIRRPAVPWRYVVWYGLAQGAGQFGLLFTAIHLGMPAGMASLVVQTQAFFTLLFSVILLREPSRAHHWIGLSIASIGLALIASVNGVGPSAMTSIGFVLTLGAAAMWAVSNIIVRLASQAAPGYDPLAFVVWSSAAPVVPLFAAAVYLDGAEPTWTSIRTMGWTGWLSVAYLALFATMLAYSLWTSLLSRHGGARIAPFSLLVPIVGLAAAALAYDEHLLPLQWLGAAVVLLGLVANQFGGRLLARLRAN